MSGTLLPRSDLYAFDMSLVFNDDAPDSNPLDGLTFTGIVYYDATRKSFDMAGVSGDGKQAIGLSASGPN